MSDYDAASSRTTAGANKQAFIYGLLGGLVAIGIAVFIMVQVGILSVPGKSAATYPQPASVNRPGGVIQSIQEDDQRMKTQCYAKGGVWMGAMTVNGNTMGGRCSR